MYIANWTHTHADGHHGSIAASNAVGGHNTDSVYHIVGYRDCNVCFTDGECTNIWTDSDGVVDWSLTITWWRLPLYCEGHTVPTTQLNNAGENPGKGGRS